MEQKELTKAEEQIMQVLWTVREAFVKDIIDQMAEPKPAYNTVSTIIRILESKGFVSHKVFGKSHQYYPVIQKEEYKKLITGKLLQGYFENSATSMLSFFLKEKQVDLAELEEIIVLMNKHKQ